jgi:hypothetical protein
VRLLSSKQAAFKRRTRSIGSAGSLRAQRQVARIRLAQKLELHPTALPRLRNPDQLRPGERSFTAVMKGGTFGRRFGVGPLGRTGKQYRPLLCRFLDAGITRRFARSGSRRPKSAKARSRGELGSGWRRALWGFDVRAEFAGGRDTGPRRPACLPARAGERVRRAYLTHCRRRARRLCGSPEPRVSRRLSRRLSAHAGAF